MAKKKKTIVLPKTATAVVAKASGKRSRHEAETADKSPRLAKVPKLLVGKRDQEALAPPKKVKRPAPASKGISVGTPRPSSAATPAPQAVPEAVRRVDSPKIQTISGGPVLEVTPLAAKSPLKHSKRATVFLDDEEV